MKMPKVKRKKFKVVKPFGGYKKGQRANLKLIGHTAKLRALGYIK